MFKNLIIYRVLSSLNDDFASNEDALKSQKFVSCSGSQESSSGWVEPRGQDHGSLLEFINGHWIMKFMFESKVVPASVVKRKVEEHVQKIEVSTGRKPGKKEMRDLKDSTRISLLPLAFTKVSSIMVWFDPETKLLCFDSTSQGKTDDCISSLVKVFSSFTLRQINTKISPSLAMSEWLSTYQVSSADFSIDRECELKANDESKAVVRYTRHDLNTDEIKQHIALGKTPSRLAITWNERVSFLLTESLELKKVSFTDVVLGDATSAVNDVKDDSFDGDVAIATGELSQLLPALIDVLGGEIAPS